MPKVIIFYANAGQGHRKVAEAIADELSLTAPQTTVICLDALDKTNPIFRKNYLSTYQTLVTFAPWLWGLFYGLFDLLRRFAWVRSLRRFFNAFWGSQLCQWLMDESPDLVISTHFFGAELSASLKQSGRLSATLLTVVTDYVAHGFWVNAGTDFYAVMHEETRQGLIAKGVDRNIIRVTGIPVHRTFIGSFNKPAIRRLLNLNEKRLTILLTSGSFGLGPTEKVLGALDSFSDRIQVMVVCGHNHGLKQKLERLRPSFPMSVFGFVDNMAELMAVSDVVVAKPGGATATECLVVGVPIVIFSQIPGQEAHNTSLLTKYGAARVLKHPQDISGVIRDLLGNAITVREWKNQVRALARPHASREVSEWALELLRRKS